MATELAHTQATAAQQAARHALLANLAFKIPIAFNGDTFWEEVTCVGYNPAVKQLVAVVSIKQTSGYQGGLCVDGSTEYIRFFVDWGSGLTDVGLTSFTAHDIPDVAPNPPHPIQYMAHLAVDDATHQKFCNSPVLPLVRATLSWNTIPSLSPNAVAVLRQLEGRPHPDRPRTSPTWRAGGPGLATGRGVGAGPSRSDEAARQGEAEAGALARPATNISRGRRSRPPDGVFGRSAAGRRRQARGVCRRANKPGRSGGAGHRRRRRYRQARGGGRGRRHGVRAGRVRRPEHRDRHVGRGHPHQAAERLRRQPLPVRIDRVCRVLGRFRRHGLLQDLSRNRRRAGARHRDNSERRVVLLSPAADQSDALSGSMLETQRGPAAGGAVLVDSALDHRSRCAEFLGQPARCVDADPAGPGDDRSGWLPLLCRRREPDRHQHGDTTLRIRRPAC